MRDNHIYHSDRTQRLNIECVIIKNLTNGQKIG